VSQEGEITEAAAPQAIDSVTGAITKDLKKGGRTTLELQMTGLLIFLDTAGVEC